MSICVDECCFDLDFNLNRRSSLTFAWLLKRKVQMQFLHKKILLPGGWNGFRVYDYLEDKKEETSRDVIHDISSARRWIQRILKLGKEFSWRNPPRILLYDSYVKISFRGSLRDETFLASPGRTFLRGNRIITFTKSPIFK